MKIILKEKSGRTVELRPVRPAPSLADVLAGQGRHLSYRAAKLMWLAGFGPAPEARR